MAAVFFGTLSISATAYSWHRHPAPGPSGSVHVHISGGAAVPAIIATGIIAGITFGLIDNAVSTPASPSTTDGVCPRTVPSGSVVVTAQMLNVRSGPGLDNAAVRQLPNGTVLSVCGSAPGWYYVKTADNFYGWVMNQYTAPAGYPVSG